VAEEQGRFLGPPPAVAEEEDPEPLPEGPPKVDRLPQESPKPEGGRHLLLRVLRRSEPLRSEPRQSEPFRSEPRRSEPHQSELRDKPVPQEEP